MVECHNCKAEMHLVRCSLDMISKLVEHHILEVRMPLSKPLIITAIYFGYDIYQCSICAFVKAIKKPSMTSNPKENLKAIIKENVGVKDNER